VGSSGPYIVESRPRAKKEKARRGEGGRPNKAAEKIAVVGGVDRW